MKPKKQLGQHFLTNHHYAQQIANYATSQGEKNVHIIEVGPGEGFLTQYLLESAPDLVMVEYDQDLIGNLKIRFGLKENQIIVADFLQVNLKMVFDGQAFALVGNFPYNISSQIVFKVIENQELIPLCVGMFQKEVAQRIASLHGTKKYGILSVLTKVFYDVKTVFQIAPGNFNPPPKVDSTVISLHRKPQAMIELKDYPLLAKVVKSAFQQRRKMLRNSISAWLNEANKVELSPYLTLRPEQLSVADFVSLTLIISKNK